MIPQPLHIDPKWLPAIGDFEALTRYHIGPDGGNARIKFSRQEKRVLRKRKKIAPSAWAEKHRYLPRDAAVPGRWKNTTVPYAPAIMDAAFYPSVQEIVLCFAPQGAKTEIVYTCMGYTADRKPGNWLVVFPNEIDAKDNASDRITPMFNDSPRLRSYRTGYADDETGIKITLQHMRITMAWATSAARLANRPLPYVFLDEEDKYPPTVGKKESSPHALSEKRMRTYKHMRKMFRASTPTVEDGAIWVGLNNCHLIFDYFVVCPHCGREQLMAFEQIKWTAGVRDPMVIEATRDVWYECVHCKGKWDDGQRKKAVRAGQWRDRKKRPPVHEALEAVRPLRIGFHAPAWVSPFVDMWECAAAFLKAQKGQPGHLIALRDFNNGFAARPWRATASAGSEDRIMALADDRPRGVVPAADVVACLLAGVDTQDDGFYYEIRAFGWGMEKESWCVQEGKVPTFAALAQVLWENEYRDTDGNVYHVHLAMQDSAGHRTSEVYDFCRMHRGRVFPTKGMQTMSTPYTFRRIDHKPSGKPIPGGVRLFRIDTNYYKNMLAGILEISPGDPGCWWYHKDVTLDWARQMSAEGIDEKGMWVNSRNRANHAWDCAVLLLMAHDFLNVATRRRPTPGGKAAKKQSKPAAQRIKLW